MPFLLFLTIPLIELYLLLNVGARIGLLPTLGTIILTAALGSYFVRKQGFSILRELQQEIARGGLPGTQLVEGMLVAVSGLLLLTPGFLTDAVGLAMLVPTARRAVVASLMRRFSQSSGFSHTVYRSNQTVRPEDFRRIEPRASEMEIVDNTSNEDDTPPKG